MSGSGSIALGRSETIDPMSSEPSREIPDGMSPDARETWPSTELISSWLGDQDIDFEFRPGEDVAVHDDPEHVAAARRFRDVLGRFGGEEFVVTIFGLHPTVAVGAAERIRSRVAGQRHQLSGSRGGESCSITCTIGLAASHPHGYDLTRLLDLADIALAAGKAAGRDQVRDARTVLADVGVDEASGGAGTRQRSLWRVATRRRSIWSVATRPRSDRRTLRHGPGSMFR